MLETYGMLSGIAPVLSCLITITAYATLGFVGAGLLWWTLLTFAIFWLFEFSIFSWALVGVPLLIFNIKPLRRALVSSSIVGLLKKLKILPEISETEKVALEAGSTWVDSELFSGKPNFDQMQKEPYTKVSEEELRFMNNQVDTLCQMADDWEMHKNGDVTPEVWEYLKKEKFFGMIIPKKYGGLGFSAIANSETVSKISSRSTALAVNVMVPNSLGPAELLSHYGTESQKKYYLPRLAVGEEIPCFALTEPTAGSDAGAIQSTGIVFKGDDGKLYVRLTWNKRYITLAAVSTLLGLAIKLEDPENHLGKGRYLGITCVLVPADTKGVVLGKRHNPMGIPFYNCPTSGKDVVVSVDQIIGGPSGAGRGWQMLMECLAAGRAISLPAQATGGTKKLAMVTSSYASFRKQFGLSIGRFEGIEEPLARIFGLTYLLEASRIFTCGAVDQGIKPSVVSAIAKYNTTEINRTLTNDAMDILGGAAISRGPRNLVANAYIGLPISITVEGANILTRSMIIFGQGAIRCHPFAYQELKALSENDIAAFDQAFWGHVGFVIRNFVRALLLSISRGYLAKVPNGLHKKYYRKLAWASASFAFMSDLALGTYGGGLKLREKLTGRYADVLSWMYLALATIRRFEAEGQKKEHMAFLEWSLDYSFARIQDAFDGIYQNFDAPVLKWIFRGPVGLWSRINRINQEPSDKLGHKIVDLMLQPGDLRDSMTPGVFVSPDKEDSMNRYEAAFKLTYECGDIYRQLQKAVRKKRLPKGPIDVQLEKAVKEGIITQAEAEQVKRAEQVRLDAIQVDSFSADHYHTGLMEQSAMGG